MIRKEMRTITALILFAVLAFLFGTANAQTYRNADLPDAMTFLDGRKVKTMAEW